MSVITRKSVSERCSSPWELPPSRLQPSAFSLSAVALRKPKAIFLLSLLFCSVFSDIFSPMEITWQAELQMELNWVILRFIIPDCYLCFAYLKAGSDFSVDNLSLVQSFLVSLFLYLINRDQACRTEASSTSLPNAILRPAGFPACDPAPAARLCIVFNCLSGLFLFFVLNVRWHCRQVVLSLVYAFCSHNTAAIGNGLLCFSLPLQIWTTSMLPQLHQHTGLLFRQM